MMHFHWHRVLGMRLANVYDIDQKTYLIKLARWLNPFDLLEYNT